jgi:prevent-host-death family protein
MPTITAFEAKTRFGELLNRVARGEEIVITRHEKPVARLVPEGHSSLAQIQEAVGDIHRLRERISRQPGFRKLTQKQIKDAVNEGRP